MPFGNKIFAGVIRPKVTALVFFFSVAVIKTPTETTQGRKNLFWLIILWSTVHHCWKAWCQELAGCIASICQKERVNRK